MMQVSSNLKHRFDNPNGPTAYSSEKSGMPVVCLHGFGGSGLDFEGISEHISPGFNPIGLNVPGHGGLALTQKPMDQILKSVQAFNTEPIILLGYSMGGRIALRLAVSGALDIAQLVLIGTTPGMKSPEEQQSRRRFENQISARLLELSPPEFESWWRTLPPIKTQSRMPQSLQSDMRRRRALNDLGHLNRALEVFGTSRMPPMWSALNTLSIPTMLITGEEDHKYLDIAQRMNRVLPRSCHVNVAGCGHAPHLESPARTASVLNRQLAALLD